MAKFASPAIDDRELRLRRIKKIHQRKLAATGEPIAVIAPVTANVFDPDDVDQSSPSPLWDPDELGGS
jgi:hypothetical protein